MPRELAELMERADSIGRIKRYCDKLRADARVDFDMGRLETEDDLEVRLDEIQAWYEDCAEAVEARQEQG